MMSPSHWESRGALAWALLPVAWLYRVITALRMARITPQAVSVPVICVGNNTVGGAGKTPTVIALCTWLQQAGKKPAVISRGYRGQYQGTVKVDPALHDATEVGDEPLLIAQHAPCYVARRRLNAARAAIAEGADVIIMDDGLQNPSLIKSLSILVVDGGYGFGNRFLLPAGPCRESVARSMRKADMVLILGEQTNPRISRAIPADKPTYHGVLQPDALSLQGKKLHPFAGIAHPEKFFATVQSLRAEITLSTRFPDHHYFTQADIEQLQREATQHDAQLITTEKDYVRLPYPFKEKVMVLPVQLQVQQQENMLQQILQGIAS